MGHKKEAAKKSKKRKARRKTEQDKRKGVKRGEILERARGYRPDRREQKKQRRSKMGRQ